MKRRIFGRERGLRGSSFDASRSSFERRFSLMFWLIIGTFAVAAILGLLTFFGVIKPSKEFMEMMQYHERSHGRGFMDDDDDF